MPLFFQPTNYTEDMLRIGDVYFCLRAMKLKVSTHKYEMCITQASDGEYVPVYLNYNHPCYQGTYSFNDSSDYDKILSAMKTGERELVSALEAVGYKFKLWADTLKHSLPDAEHKSYRAFVA